MQSHQVLTEVQSIYSGHHLEHPEHTISYIRQPSKTHPLEVQYLRDANISMFLFYTMDTDTQIHTHRKNFFKLHNYLFKTSHCNTTHTTGAQVCGEGSVPPLVRAKS